MVTYGSVSDSVAITGVGVVSPFGDSPERFRDALLAGETGIVSVPQFKAFDCRSTLAARVASFDPAAWIPPMKLRRMDTTGPFALVAIQQAMTAAGYAVCPDGDARTGVVLGTYSAGGPATFEYLDALFKGGPSGAPALLFNSTVGNAAAGLAGLEYKLRGPNATIGQKESSGLAAIAAAADLIRLDRADRVATGGIDAIWDLFYRVHDRFHVMSEAVEAGEATAPFSRARQGFVMGEGGYVVWLEKGARGPGVERCQGVRAEILGTGAGGADAGINAWPRDPQSIARVMTLAIEDAGLSPSDINVVYASANATVALDDVEGRALTMVFGPSRPVVTSIKGAIGESGAASAAACVAAVLCGAVGKVPPIAGLTEPDHTAGALNLAGATTDAPGDVVLLNSIASGGALAAVVVRVLRQA
jgi:3-oxoacyl-[acyl-carrier-protein] synthase II